MNLQRWLNLNVLDYALPHEASVAFSRGNSIREAASAHCGAKWLIKLDIRNFFESVTEAQVYRVFEGIGYQPLVAFELARICTRLGNRQTHAEHPRYQVRTLRWHTIRSYSQSLMGHLPQGAPTSPRLANLTARSLDIALTNIAHENSLIYTRYADDLTFSTSKSMNRRNISHLIGNIYRQISNNGFSPNTSKTSVSPPGSRKIVLGLLVDREAPKLTREFKARLRQHLYYLKKAGPSSHATHLGNATVFGLRRHVLGLIHYAKQIDPEYGYARLDEFNALDW
jgi:retron-type reverse transcriptase